MVAIGALLLSTAVCHDSTEPDPVTCLLGAIAYLPPIQVTALDAETGAVITAGVTGTVHSSLGATPLEQQQSGMLFGAASAGTVSVTVHANGYADWTRGNLVLKPGPCGPLPLMLAAWLVK